MSRWSSKTPIIPLGRTVNHWGVYRGGWSKTVQISVPYFMDCPLLCYLCRFRVDRLLNFTVGLTDQKPNNGSGQFNSPFLKCATHGEIGRFETVSLNCTHPLHAWRRYLFLAANVRNNFLLMEVEVFNGKLI